MSKNGQGRNILYCDEALEWSTDSESTDSSILDLADEWDTFNNEDYCDTSFDDLSDNANDSNEENIPLDKTQDSIYPPLKKRKRSPKVEKSIPECPKADEAIFDGPFEYVVKPLNIRPRVATSAIIEAKISKDDACHSPRGTPNDPIDVDIDMTDMPKPVVTKEWHRGCNIPFINKLHWE